ncbi:MAG: chlorophyll a/b-binding protein [Cyanobacteria bacterium J06639_14]
MQESQSVPSAQEETTDKPETDAPAIASDVADPSFGWNSYAERINGRFAMVGFVALLVLELFTRQDFFTWLGF